MAAVDDFSSILKACIDGKPNPTLLNKVQLIASEKSQERIQNVALHLHHHVGQQLIKKVSLPLKEAQALVLLQFWEALLKPIIPAEEEEDDDEDENDNSGAGELWGPLFHRLGQPIQVVLQLILPKVRTQNRVFRRLMESFVLRAVQFQPLHTLRLLVEFIIRDQLCHFLGLPEFGLDLLTASLELNLSLNLPPASYVPERDTEDTENEESSRASGGDALAAQAFFMSAFVERVEAALMQDHTSISPALQVLCEVQLRVQSFPMCQVRISNPAASSEQSTSNSEVAGMKALVMLWTLLVRTLKTAQMTEVGLTFGLQALLKLLPSVIGLLPRCLSDLQFILRKVLKVCVHEAIHLHNLTNMGQEEVSSRPLIFDYLETANDSAENSNTPETVGWTLSSGCYMLGPYSDPHFSGSLFGFGETPDASSPLHHCLPHGKGAHSRIRQVTTWSGLTGIVGIQLTVMEFSDDIELPVQGSTEGEKQSLHLDAEEFLVGACAYFSGGSLFGLALTTNRGEKTPALGPGDQLVTLGPGVIICGQQTEMSSNEGVHQGIPIKDELVDFCGNLGPQGGFATLGAVFRQSTTDPWMLHTTMKTQSPEVLLHVAKELFETLYILFPWFTVRFLRAEVANDPQLCSVASAFLASVRAHPHLLMDTDAELRGDRWNSFSTSEVNEYLHGLSVALSQGDDGLNLSFASLYKWMQTGLTEEKTSIMYAHLKRLSRNLVQCATPSFDEFNVTKRQPLHNRKPPSSASRESRSPKRSEQSVTSSRSPKQRRVMRKRLSSYQPKVAKLETEAKKEEDPEMVQEKDCSPEKHDQGKERRLLCALQRRVMWINAELIWEKQRQMKEFTRIELNTNQMLKTYKEQLALFKEEKESYSKSFEKILEQRKQEEKEAAGKQAHQLKAEQEVYKSRRYSKSLSAEIDLLKQLNEELTQEKEKLQTQTQSLAAEVATLKSQLSHESRWKEEFTKQYKQNRKLIQTLEVSKQKRKQPAMSDHVQRREKVIKYLLAQVQHLQGIIDKEKEAAETPKIKGDASDKIVSGKNSTAASTSKKGSLQPSSIWHTEEELRMHVQHLEELCKDQARTIKSLELMLKQSQEGASARIDASDKKYATLRAAHSSLEHRVIQLMKERSESKVSREKSEALHNSLSSEDLQGLKGFTSGAGERKHMDDLLSGQGKPKRSYEKLVKFPRSSNYNSQQMAKPGKITNSYPSGKQPIPTKPSQRGHDPASQNDYSGAMNRSHGSKSSRGSTGSGADNLFGVSPTSEDKDQRKFANANAGCKPS